MEPERAAAVIQRLPDDEVTRVLGAMEPDSAGEIMNALPPAVAARISRASAQVSATSGR
jgi:flagellar motility protein MotE (MotC chaperone)